MVVGVKKGAHEPHCLADGGKSPYPLGMWAFLGLLAGLLQSARISLSKSASTRLSAVSITFTRFFYAIPLVVAYLGILTLCGYEVGKFTAASVVLVVISAISQAMGNALLVRSFSYFNFVTAASLYKSDIILCAIWGSFVGQALSREGWSVLLIILIGVLLSLSTKKSTLVNSTRSKKRLFTIPLGAACSIALSSMSARWATEQFIGGAIISNSACVLILVLLTQSLILGFLAVRFHQNEMRLLRDR
jgi:hypothetical protein